MYLKIARLHLEEERHAEAEAYINRATGLLPDVTKKELVIVHRVSMSGLEGRGGEGRGGEGRGK